MTVMLESRDTRGAGLARRLWRLLRFRAIRGWRTRFQLAGAAKRARTRKLCGNVREDIGAPSADPR